MGAKADSHFILLFTVSCNKQESKYKCEQTFSIEKSIVDNVFEWPKSIKIDRCVRLETCDSVLIGSVKKIIVEGDKYYIFDSKNKTIFEFNQEGKFISKICRQGNGPQEYVEIRDFDLNKGGDIISILDYKNVVKYNVKNGAFVRKVKINEKINPLQLICFENNVNYFWNGTSTNDDKNCFFRESDGNLQGLLENDNYIIETDRFTKKWNGNYLLVPPHGDFNIYEITEEEMSVKYSIDFGELALPINSIATKNNIDEIGRGNYFKRITNIQETKDWLYVLAIGPEGKYYEVLLNKNEKESYTGKFNSDSSFRIVSSDATSFYALVEPLYILNASKKSILYSLKEMKLSEFDNPLIVKFSF
ncbi:MAG: 6-bladed beta-propeller [Paludibacter sp.]|nr:6-bladed beta-propeller [Paludibacter sp.]